MQRVSFGHEAHVQTAFGRVGTRHTPKFHSTSPMKQKRKLQQKPTKSRAWLEAECLKLARRTLGGSEIQRARDGEHRAHGRRRAPDPSHPHADYRGWPAGAHEASMALILKRASVSRTSGEWREDDYDVLGRRDRGRPHHEGRRRTGGNTRWPTSITSRL